MTTSLTFQHSAPLLTPQQVTQVETSLGFPLPSQFKAFYLRHNGGVPSKAYVFDQALEDFLEISVFSSLWHKLPHRDTLEADYQDLTGRGVLPAGYLPFATDWGGNLFCLQLATHQVVFILMDLGEFTEDCVSPLARSFDAFLDALVSAAEATEQDEKQ
ncbi:MAG: SMI1/KNR4 family protein [Hymenobacter sp.]|nr:MAG: SMI1/KNR4 family protein [Hymenobacter sp.]